MTAATKPPTSRRKRTAKASTASGSASPTVLALDAGNYDLKFFNGVDHPKAIRSVRFELPMGRDPVRYSEASPLIELPDGRRVHFGTQAYKYRRQQQTVVENKVELAKLHLYACVSPLNGQIFEYPLSLYVSTPDPGRHGELLKAQLLGVHRFKRNEQDYCITVDQVAVVREGMGAYEYAKHQGHIPAEGYTIVVDIGGGTWLTRLVDAEGDVIDENVLDRGGTYDLAASISFDKRLTDALGTSADPCLVMDGFRDNHEYADTGLSWTDWIDEHLDPWFKGIFQTVKAQYTPYMARVTQFLVTGGGSHLIADRLAERRLFTVMGDPQFANVRGLQLLSSNDTQLCMTTK